MLYSYSGPQTTISACFADFKVFPNRIITPLLEDSPIHTVKDSINEELPGKFEDMKMLCLLTRKHSLKLDFRALR